MKHLYTFITIVYFCCAASAQPGGGGGLNIGNFYDAQLEPIDIRTDPSVKIRTFLLREGNITQETFGFVEAVQRNNNRYNLPGYYLPPVEPDVFSGFDQFSDQRVYIIHKKDTTMIDFMGVYNQNAAGHIDKMDSLVLKRGYFKYYRAKDRDKYRLADPVRQSLKHGFTAYTIKHLTPQGYIEYKPKADIAFLKESNLPASYFLKKARYDFQRNKLDSTGINIQRGIAKNSGIEDCESMFLFYDLYSRNGNFNMALEYITKAIGCKRSTWQGIEDNYRSRIELYIILKNYSSAVADYNILLSISRNKDEVIIDFANFKTKYLNDAKGAIADLKMIIDAIPHNYLDDRLGGIWEFSDAYFALSNAEYRAKNKKAAFRHLLTAFEFGYVSNRGNIFTHFDTIIKKHPDVPTLYLARAFAHYRYRDQTQKTLVDAFTDLDKSEHLGLKDHRINLLRANLLYYEKKHQEALAQINLAILKDKRDPRLYLVRSHIRRALGKAEGDYSSDVDVRQSKILTAKWKWYKY